MLDSPFVIDKGISGILFSDGRFAKCGNGQHHYLVADIPFEVQTTCLYFSSSMRGEGDGLITHSPIGFPGVTEVQKLWLNEHFKYMDCGQKRRCWINFNINI